jgi:hypothetical protein
MRQSVGYLVSILLLLPAFSQVDQAISAPARGDVFTKDTIGEPAILASLGIVPHRPIAERTVTDASGAFAVDAPPPEMYHIEANVPVLSVPLAVEGSAGTPSPDGPEIFLLDDDRKWLKATECSFNRKVHHA